MNEWIKELAQQARNWVNDHNNVSPEVSYEVYKNAYDEKFAELIVKECAHVALMSNGNNLHVCELIKQHFGVKE